MRILARIRACQSRKSGSKDTYKTRQDLRACIYLIIKDLFGGEGGIRPIDCAPFNDLGRNRIARISRRLACEKGPKHAAGPGTHEAR